MYTTKEDYLKIWNVQTFNGERPDWMQQRVQGGARIAFCAGANLDEVRCVTSKSYSKMPDEDRWHETSFKVKYDSGNAYLYARIGRTLRTPIEFRIDPSDKGRIMCIATFAPTGTWSGDDD